MDDFRASMLAEMAAGYGITNQEIQAQYEGVALERAPQNWRWVLATARALERTPLGPKMIDLVTRDVYVYLSSSGTRSAVDSIVAKLMPPDEPCVVVAHSLGTVVAYNVLSRLPKLDVRLFATLGSPLGIKAVKEKNGLPLRFPTCVQQWFNARDPRDIVALRPLDDTFFWIRPTIENTSGVVNFTNNRHSIEGYLEDAVVATRIHAALTES
jgi:pimeloyl-ACP methyl ester carboxylesterase